MSGSTLFGALGLILVGAFLLLFTLDVLEWDRYYIWGVEIWHYWPLTLVAWGAWLLWKRTRQPAPGGELR